MELEYKNLKKIMEYRNINASELGRITGKTRGTISAYFNKRANPPIEWFCEVADYFDCSVDCLLDRVEIDFCIVEMSM